MLEESEASEASAKKGQKGFTKGVSGNPNGRPKGSKNKTTLLAEAMLEDEAENLVRSVIDRAHDGDPTATKICMQWILGKQRGRKVKLDLLDDNGMFDLEIAQTRVYAAVGEGEITLEEGVVLLSMVLTSRKIFPYAV